MKYTTRHIILQTTALFFTKSIGISGTTFEVCFNTGMTGYQEIFTDPSYYGQIMVATNAHIGNYGVNENEVESDGIKISGLVCKISVSITLELIPQFRGLFYQAKSYLYFRCRY
jgi:carbamoyl-phosphate synthase small subunit